MLRSTVSFLTLTFLFLTGACDPKPGDTDSGAASASTTDASTTDESPTSGATDDGATTGNDEPTVATTADDTGSDDTGSDTTGPVDPEHQSACEAACKLMLECEGEDEAGVDACATECAGEFQELEAECVPLNLAVAQCIAQLTCAELDGEEEPCDAEFLALEACAGSGQECTQSVGQEADGCGVSTFCPEQPTREIFCDAETCVCSLDGVEVAQCPADDVCAEGDAIFDKMASCCQFE